MNARQEAFVALKDLFTAIVMTMPARELTKKEEDMASEVLAEQFTKIMDQYDERIRYSKHRISR